MAKKDSNKSKTQDGDLIQLKELLFELEKNILATKKKISAEDKKSADYLEKMARLDTIRSKNRNEYHRIKRQINQIEKESQKRDEQTLQSQENLVEKIKDENKELNEQLEIKKEKKKITRKEVELERELGVLQEKSTILMQILNKDTLKNAEILKITGKSVGEIADKTQEITKLFKGTNEETRIFEKTLHHTKTNASSIDKLSLNILENMENMKKKGYQLVETYELEKQLKEQTVRLDLNKKKIGTERYDIQKKLLVSQIQEFNKLKEINKQLAEKSKSSKAVRESMAGWIAVVPGGNFLLNKLGLGKILQESKGIKETIKGWGTAAKGLAAALPFMALAGFFSLLVKVFTFGIKLVFDLDQRISDLSKQFQLSRVEATNMFATLGGMALRMNIIGINVKELADSLSYLADEYGISIERLRNSTMKSGWLEGITILREKFQLTSEEALNFGKIAASQNMTMDQLAYNAERMSKGVLNTKSAFKAIGSVPMLIANGMKNAVGDLVKFVAKAKSMGIDIKAFSDALFGMMDIEQSLSTQMEAQVITGFEFKNIDKVRELANVFGGEGKAFDLMMEDLSKIKDLNEVPGQKLGVKKIAETYGFTLDQFMDIFNRAKELEKVFGARNPMASMEKILSMNVDQLNAAAKKAKTAAQRDFLIGEARKRTGASMEEKITDKGEKIQIEMMEKLIPVVDRLHKMVDSVLNSGELKKVVSMIAETLPTVFNGMIKLAEVMVASFKKVLELVEKTRDVLIDVGVLQRVKKEGPIKKGDDPYETRVNPKLLPFDDTGSNMLFYGGLGIAGAIAAGNAIMHPIKTTKALYKGGKALYKGGKWVKNKMFPGKGTVPDVKPPTSIADDVMKTGTNLVDMKTGTNLVDDAAKTGTTSVGKIGKQYYVEEYGKFYDEGSYVNKRPASLGAPKMPATRFDYGASTKAGKGMFSSVGPFFKNQFSKITSVVDDAVKFALKTAPKTTSALKTGTKFLGKASLPLELLLTGYDFMEGASRSKEIFKTKKTSVRQDVAAGAGAVAGRWLGKDTGDTIAKSAYGVSKKGGFFPGLGILNFINDNPDRMGTDYGKKLQSADKQRAATKQKTINQFNNPGPSLFDKAWNSIFGVEQKTQPVKTASTPMYQTTRPISDQKPVIVNVNTVPLEQKIEKLIMLISGMASQPTYIKIGEQTVEAIRSELNLKKSYNIHVNNRYSGGASD